MRSLQYIIAVVIGLSALVLSGCAMPCKPVTVPSPYLPQENVRLEPMCARRLKTFDTRPCYGERAKRNHEACVFVGTILNEFCVLTGAPNFRLGVAIIDENTLKNLSGAEIEVQVSLPDVDYTYRVREFWLHGIPDKQVQDEAKRFFGLLFMQAVPQARGPI